MTIINLAPRYQAAYGFAPVMNQVQIPPGAQYVPYNSTKVYTPQDRAFEDMHLNGNGFDLHFGAAALTKSGDLGTIFAPPPMIAFSISKKVIITSIDGDDENDIPDTEVVEHWNNSSWDIRIQGLLVDMAEHHYPFDRIKTLRQVIQVKDVFDVSGQIFDALNITNMYILDADFTPLQGFEDTIVFSLNARSIRPADFYINGEV